jgi:gamma-tubulin complex component 3
MYPAQMYNNFTILFLLLHLFLCDREDLAKPPQTLFLHNLTGILETAIRATNAQYDDADILKRLDVRLLEVSQDLSFFIFTIYIFLESIHANVFFKSQT